MSYIIPEGFEQVHCPNCGQNDYTLVRVGRDWVLDLKREIQVVRCNACELCYTNPRPDNAHLAAYYAADYAPYQRQQGELQRSTKISTHVRGWVLASAYGSGDHRPHGWRGIVAGLVRAVRPQDWYGFGVPFEGSGKLLDFGCGNGTFLRRMAAVGWDVTGIDFSPEAVAAVRASGIRAVQGSLPHADLTPASFDVVTMRQALEHVPNPREVLMAAHDLLRPGGLLVIAVPNFAGWEIDFFGDAAMTLDLPRHLLHFSPQTLRNLLKTCGFEVERVNQKSDRGWLRKSAARSAQRQPNGWAWMFRIKALTSAIAMWVELRGRGNELNAFARRPVRDKPRAAVMSQTQSAGV